MKTYLYPVVLRKAQPILIAVEKKYNAHWMVTFSELKRPRGFTKVFKGLGNEYLRTSASRISETMYKAFIQESRQNRINHR